VKTTLHEFEPTHFHVTMGSHEPVLRVRSGDVIRTWTVDSGGHDRNGEDITEGGNPQTGPFYLEGAEPGDSLRVHFASIRPNRTRGVSGPFVAAHTVDPHFVPELGERRGEDWWLLDLDRGTARLENPPAGLESLGDLELEPMLGCFGVAPPQGQAISCATSGEHGGNMDYRGFREGVTVDFPIFAEGGLFHLGDGHALQGDGEIVGTGIEISMDVEFSLELLKGKTIRWPRADDGTFVMAVGNARPLDQALQHATTELLRLLEQDYGLNYRAGSALLGQCIQYDVGNVFDPAYTAVAKVEKALLAKL
jgi:acetamidase/formamidase